VYKFTANLVKLILKLSGSKARVYDEHNLPKDGGFIIACTHTGYVDILNLGVAVLPREIHFMAKKQLFDIKGPGLSRSTGKAFKWSISQPSPLISNNCFFAIK